MSQKKLSLPVCHVFRAGGSGMLADELSGNLLMQSRMGSQRLPAADVLRVGLQGFVLKLNGLLDQLPGFFEGLGLFAQEGSQVMQGGSGGVAILGFVVSLLGKLLPKTQGAPIG